MNAPAQRAFTAATVALMVFAAAVLPFLPPMVETTTTSVPKMALLGVTIAVSMVLHWVFLGIAVRRLQRSVFGWVALSVLLFPLGSVIALIVLAFFDDETQRQHA